MQVKAKTLRIEKTLEIKKSDPFLHLARVKLDKHKNWVDGCVDRRVQSESFIKLQG